MPEQFKILLNPGMCSDPHILLEIMCLKYTFKFHVSCIFTQFWSEMDVNFIIVMCQIDVDKYISSCLDDKLLYFEFLKQILKKLGYDLEDVTIPIPTKSFIFETAAKRLNKISLSELTNFLVLI